MPSKNWRRANEREGIIKRLLSALFVAALLLVFPQNVSAQVVQTSKATQRFHFWVNATHRLQSQTAFPLAPARIYQTDCHTGCYWRNAIIWYRKYKYWHNVRNNIAHCYPAQCYRFIVRRFSSIGQVSMALYISHRESHWQYNICNPGVICPYYPTTACGIFQFMPQTWGLGHSCTDAVINVNTAFNYVRLRHTWGPWSL